MNIQNIIWAIDAHTTGSPIRIITSGIPKLEGETISEKIEYMRTHYDHLRRMIAQQPRGFSSLVCAVLTPTSVEGADYGLFYMDADTYQPMCGAGTLATAKALVECGLVARRGDETTVTFETAAGIVKATVRYLEDGGTTVTMVNAPAFAYKEDLTLEVEGLGTVNMDIYFGGNFFAIVDTEQLGYRITAGNIPRMLVDMKKIVKAVQQNVHIEHPLNPAINYLDECLFIQNTADDDGGYMGQCIFGDGLYDLSPCGTGTCARLAQRHNRGWLNLGETFVHKQAFGGKFFGVALEEIDIKGHKGVIPQVSCSDVHVTGFNQLIAESSDRLKHGFKTL